MVGIEPWLRRSSQASAPLPKLEFGKQKIIGHLQQSNSTRVLELLALLKRPHKIESEYQVWEEVRHPQLIETEALIR